MPSYIPFINSQADCALVSSFYQDAPTIRVSLQEIQEIRHSLPKHPQLWLDPSVDAFHHGKDRLLKPRWWDEENKKGHLNKFPNCDRFFDAKFLEKPDKPAVKDFVWGILDLCLAENQAWITVPQLPVTEGTSRNKINRCLASATADWKQHRAFRGKLVLPMIFTQRRQVTGKTLWGPKANFAFECYKTAQAEAIWVVDSSLNDQEGSSTLGDRFEGLVKLHDDLANKLDPHSPLIAGPYWGLNLVLWARGLASCIAIGIGSSYQYYIPGSTIKKAALRTPLPPLKRLARLSPELRSWLKDTLQHRLSAHDAARKSFLTIENECVNWDENRAKAQIAQFYKQWYDGLEAIPVTGRALALYQDLSSAYVVGKALGLLPPVEKTARRPERVAQQLMLVCL